MANETVELDPGTGGSLVAVDDAGADGVVQIIKLAISADGSATVIPADAANGLDVDVTRLPALPAGSNNIGDVDVASIAAGDNNIGNVDVVTVPADPFGANADAAASAGGTGSISAKLRNATALLDAIKTAVETLDNTVGGSELQVDVVGALPAGSNNIGDVDIASALPAGNNNIGDVDIASAIPAGNNNIGDVDVASIAAGTNAIGNVGITPRTTGGLSVAKLLDIDESEDQIKSSAGQVFGWWLYNDGAAEVYVKFYNDTAANVTVGTTAPLFTVVIPAGSGANAFTGVGIAFSTAITIAATTGPADNNTGAPATDQVVGSVFYA